MSQYRLYNSEDIEKMKRDLQMYKNNITTRRTDGSFKADQKAHKELYDLKLKFSMLKGEMKFMEESYHKKITEYEEQDKKISTQIQTITESLNNLKQDVNTIEKKIEEIQFSELHKKIDHIMNKVDDNIAKVNNEINSQNEEFLRLKEKIQPNTQKNKVNYRPSEYRQLQNMFHSSKNMEQVSNVRNNSMNKSLRKSMPLSNQSKITKPFENRQDTNKGLRTSRNAQYGVNKNIITRIKTQKKNKNDNDIEKKPSAKIKDNTQPLVNDNSKEDIINGHKQVEINTETNIKKRNNYETSDVTTTVSQNKTEKKVVDQEKINDGNNEQLKQPNTNDEQNERQNQPNRSDNGEKIKRSSNNDDMNERQNLANRSDNGEKLKQSSNNDDMNERQNLANRSDNGEKLKQSSNNDDMNERQNLARKPANNDQPDQGEKNGQQNQSSLKNDFVSFFSFLRKG